MPPSFFLPLLSLVLLMTSCSLVPPDSQDIAAKKTAIEDYDGAKDQALFAGGCFWCVESAFEHVDGVIAAISGFAGGDEKDPTYDQVASGQTEHLESVLVIFDPDIVSYRELVDYFWKQIDPTDGEGQFVDRGYQYTSAIFYTTDEQKQIAEASRKELEESGVFDDPIVTQIIPATEFYPAEEYHQDYYKNNPIRYNYYRFGSGRDQFLKKVWGEKTSDGL